MSQLKRIKVKGADATYHAMSRVVGGQRLFGDREKEVLRKMLWRVADFCGVEILTYCVMSNHFHVLVRVPEHGENGAVSDAELLRRFKVLYPKPTKYQTAEFARLEKSLKVGDEDAPLIRARLLVRMHDLSEFMKTVKQRFSIWYNRNHGDRRGTLWMDRFKSVLVEGRGNPLQTMAAYIDLNSVRAGVVEDPKDYRFCGYAEAVAGNKLAKEGLRMIWADYLGSGLAATDVTDLAATDLAATACLETAPYRTAMQLHRELIFGKRGSDAGISEKSREKALKVLEGEGAVLPKATVLRCRVRYFTDGVILGSQEFVQGFTGAWQLETGRKYPPKPKLLKGADWQGLATMRGLRAQVFG